MKKSPTLAQLRKIALRPSLWDASAEKWSRTIPHDFPGDFAALLKSRVENGSCEIRNLTVNGAVVGYIVFEVCESPHCPPELVIVAMAGRDGSDITEQVHPLCKILAAECGCKSIRFHTMRPGLVLKAESLGFRVSEIILRSDV